MELDRSLESKYLRESVHFGNPMRVLKMPSTFEIEVGEVEGSRATTNNVVAATTELPPARSSMVPIIVASELAAPSSELTSSDQPLITHRKQPCLEAMVAPLPTVGPSARPLSKRGESSSSVVPIVQATRWTTPPSPDRTLSLFEIPLGSIPTQPLASSSRGLGVHHPTASSIPGRSQCYLSPFKSEWVQWPHYDYKAVDAKVRAVTLPPGQLADNFTQRVTESEASRLIRQHGTRRSHHLLDVDRDMNSNKVARSSYDMTMWRLKIMEGGSPWLCTTNNHAGRPVWEFDPNLGTPEEIEEVERAQEAFRESRFEKKNSADLLMRLQV
ncbi:hypothetical protein ZIOFF_063695 [Zingiber officinale]|uniref:Uncharacterized protein n=1 Tax=Zingiber officinale TaxID=94328 RepID=A0A8J5F281_ZINOF|nr:hypothetical protein ZIOFF_063695 [Zingiber officinale]